MQNVRIDWDYKTKESSTCEKVVALLKMKDYNFNILPFILSAFGN